MISMGSPSGLHHIALRGKSRESCAWPSSHHIDNDAGNFRNDRKAQIFLHQGKSWSTGGCHRLRPCQRGTDHRTHAGDLILHLNESPIHLRQSNR